MDLQRIGGVMFGLCLMVTLQAASAEEDFVARLRAFEKKVSEVPLTDPKAFQQNHISTQLKTLRMMLEQQQFERAQHIISNIGFPGLPVELQKEWLTLTESYTSELEKMTAAAQSHWNAEIDKLVGDVRELCLKAERATDLEPAMIRVAALQIQRFGQDTILTRRSTQKLAGVSETLESFAKYLDLRNAEDPKGANELLQGLMNRRQFPILSNPEIEAKLLPEAPKNIKVALEQVSENVKTPDDIALLIEKLRKLKVNDTDGSSEAVTSELRRWEQLQKQWEATSTGENESALRSLQQASINNLSVDLTNPYQRIRDQIVRAVIHAKVKSFTGLAPGDSEDTIAFLGRVLDESHEKQNYAAMIEVMSLTERLAQFPQRGNDPLMRDKAVIEKYLAGQRFEAAGDLLAAMTSYRQVVASTGGKYAPLEPASEALERIKTKAPELFMSAESMVLEELRALRSALERGYLGRSGGGPSR